ncbi:MAG TPA: hypothetical protein VMU52_10155 [Steroidobacteraceae bacterium]|nr:hypothetical protein [Steroidobacteraceae bacterium]
MSHIRLPVLLTAAQLCCAGLASGAAHAGGWSTVWSGLWRTPDQQGQALLEAGQPAQAAARFHDPRRRAYADLEAARYPEAAKLLGPFTDADSEYNQGNALAQSGRLQAALAAYDAALKRAPADADIRHNRDLVEQALRQRRQSSRNPSASRQPGGNSPQSAGGSRRGSSGSQGSAGRGGSSSQQANAPQATGGRRGGSPRDAAGEAQNDAAFAAANARQRQRQGGSRQANQAQAPDSGRLVAGGARTPREQPESERQLLLDQWLRQIPDSPAGLLQRQFLIEHMLRQENGDGPEGSGR